MTEMRPDQLYPHQLHFIKDLVYKKTGMHIGKSKEYLIEMHLTPLLKSAIEFHTLQSFVEHLMKKPNSPHIDAVCESMMIHETSFFRDEKVFLYLQNSFLKDLFANQKNGQKVNLWSAACSRGQEAYSLAILLDLMRVPTKSYYILGSDISNEAVSCSEKGVYSQFEIQRGLRVQHILEYFDQRKGQWHLKKFIKEVVHFKRINLIEPLPLKQKFHVIFCRNVLLYFSDSIKSKVINSLLEHLDYKGKLVIGASETLLDVPNLPPLKNEGFGVWSKK